MCMKKKKSNLLDFPETIESISEKSKMRDLIEWEIKHRGMINTLYSHGSEVDGVCIPITYLPDEIPPKQTTVQPKDPFANLTEEDE